MNDKVRVKVDEILKQLGIDFSKEIQDKFRGKKIIVVEDDGSEVELSEEDKSGD